MVNLRTFFDPKVKPQGLRCEIEEAIDDRGNDLRLQSQAIGSRVSPNLGFGTNNVSSSIAINLASRPAMGKQLKKLRGVLRFTVPTRHERWEISDTKTPALRTFEQNGGLFQMQFAGLQKAGDGWAAKFVVEAQGEHARRGLEDFSTSFPGSRGTGTYAVTTNIGGDFGLHEISLIDNRGQTFTGSGTTNITRAEGRIEEPKPNLSPPKPRSENYAYRSEQTATFGGASNAIERSMFGTLARASATNVEMGAPVKLVINIPIEKREVSVPFEFSDLPLPPS